MKNPNKSDRSLEFVSYIRCPIHKYIGLTNIERKIIDTKIFQRLRGISQNSLACYTFPTALATRFDHSLGVMHLGSKIFEQIRMS
jgi:HD superfamily phosphohydrolase